MIEKINFKNKIRAYYPSNFQDKECAIIRNYKPHERFPFKMNFWGVFTRWILGLADTSILAVDLTKAFNRSTPPLSSTKQKTIRIKIYASLEEFLEVDYCTYQKLNKKYFFIGLSFDSYSFMVCYKKRYDILDIVDRRFDKTIHYDSFDFKKGFITVEILYI